MSEQVNQEEINKQLQERKALKERPSRARYNQVHAALERKWRRRKLEIERMMREVVDELWDQFGDNSPYSWCGFYLLSASGTELVLGPHHDTPAGSPLPLQGIFGKVAQSGQGMIVQNEIAVPVLDYKGKVWGIFNVKCAQAGAFNDMDQRWLERILKNFQEVDKPE